MILKWAAKKPAGGNFFVILLKRNMYRYFPINYALKKQELLFFF
jgi:hypothetical protein